MGSPGGPVKNPSRVPLPIQQLVPDPTALADPIPASIDRIAQGVKTVSFKLINEGPNAGMYSVKEDGVYENPKTGDRFQFRAGHVVPPAVSAFTKTDPWPEDATQQEQEAAATEAKADAEAPANKAEKAAPENKSA
jgi:hypothetical protein